MSNSDIQNRSNKIIIAGITLSDSNKLSELNILTLDE